MIILDHVNSFNGNFNFELQNFIDYDNRVLDLKNKKRTEVQNTIDEKRFIELNYLSKPFEFIRDIDFSSNSDCFLLTGYFQNYKFLDMLSSSYINSLSLFTKKIRNDLPANLKLEDDLCVIHVRGGDYKNIKNFGNLSKEYYLNCLDSFGKKLSEAVILTNDYSYSSQLLGDEARVIGPNELGSWETLSLMASARYLITANSTLSWWGGYIAGKFEGSKVIIPSPWFRNLDTEDAFNHPMFIKKKSMFQNNSYKFLRKVLANKLGFSRRM